MSLKRSHSSSARSLGGSDGGGKVDRQHLFDALKKLGEAGTAFAPVDVALATGAAEAQVSKALLGLAGEGVIEKVEVGKYKAGMISDLSPAAFLKVYARAAKADGGRHKDLSEIQRLKQNNDTMRQKLLAALGERDHYLAILKSHGIDPGPPPSASSTSTASPGPSGLAVPSPASVSSPSGPGDQGGH